MDWKSIKVPAGGKLFKIHNFNYIHKGTNFALEVDEYMDGTFTGHGEQASDQNYFIESVSGKDLGDCLGQLISRIQDRS
jgi:hypothetical protein